MRKNVKDFENISFFGKKKKKSTVVLFGRIWELALNEHILTQ